MKSATQKSQGKTWLLLTGKIFTIATVLAAYIVGQDALFIKLDAFFDFGLVTDHRMTDDHIRAELNVVPDVGVVQNDVVT